MDWLYYEIAAEMTPVYHPGLRAVSTHNINGRRFMTQHRMSKEVRKVIFASSLGTVFE